MEELDSSMDESPLDESIDSWIQDIKDRQLQAEANRKQYLSREDEGNFKDLEIKRNVSLLCGEAKSKKAVRRASTNIITRIESLGLDGVEKIVRNGYQ